MPDALPVAQPTVSKHCLPVLLLEVTFRSVGGGSKEKMQEDWESIDLKSVYSAVLHGRKETPSERY